MAHIVLYNLAPGHLSHLTSCYSLPHILGSSYTGLPEILPRHLRLHLSIPLPLPIGTLCLDHLALSAGLISCIVPSISPDSVQASAPTRSFSEP